MNDLAELAIAHFIKDTSVPKPLSTYITDPTRNKYKKSSRIIHYKGSKPVNSEIIINESGIGNLRELAVISDQKMNPYLEIDGNNILSSANSWDELSQITLYTTTIIAQTNGSDFILSFNKLRFMKNIFLRVDFNKKGTIKRAIGTYDLCEEL